jgi:hypothetical protein
LKTLIKTIKSQSFASIISIEDAADFGHFGMGKPDEEATVTESCERAGDSAELGAMTLEVDKAVGKIKRGVFAGEGPEFSADEGGEGGGVDSIFWEGYIIVKKIFIED